jgi:hypothetical protein
MVAHFLPALLAICWFVTSIRALLPEQYLFMVVYCIIQLLPEQYLCMVVYCTIQLLPEQYLVMVVYCTIQLCRTPNGALGMCEFTFWAQEVARKRNLL